jgi:hypothetical protein
MEAEYMGQQHILKQVDMPIATGASSNSSSAPDETNVKVLPIVNLLSRPLTIPDYQRPYTWDITNMRQLIEDIRLFMNRGYEEYRIGTVIVYANRTENRDTPAVNANANDDGAIVGQGDHPQTQPDEQQNPTLEIVDGQQRVLSFLLIMRALAEGEDQMEQTAQLCNPTIRGKVSKQHIIANYAIARQLLPSSGEKRRQFADFFMHNCTVTLFTTYSLNEAFQMFDSQNSRGKALDPTDLLKAFHLREMAKDNVPEPEQRTTISLWENEQPGAIQSLFADYLYPIRLWSRSESVTSHPFNTASVNEFKGIGLNDGQSPYAWSEPFIFAYDFVTSLRRETHASTASGALERLEYPYQIDQPVLNGSAFFSMVTHYLRLCRRIGIVWGNTESDIEPLPLVNDSSTFNQLTEHSPDSRITLCRLAFDRLLLYYVDRFGEDRVDEAVDAIFAYTFLPRLALKSVRRRSIDKYVIATNDQSSIPVHDNAFLALHNARTPSEFLSHLSIARSTIDTITEGATDDLRAWLDPLYGAIIKPISIPSESSSSQKTTDYGPTSERLDELKDLVRRLHRNNHSDDWGLFRALRQLNIITNDKGSWSYRSDLWKGENRKNDAVAALREIVKTGPAQ